MTDSTDIEAATGTMADSTAIQGPAPGYPQRIAFVVALASRLHLYGTTAQRLEAVIILVAQRMGMECQPWVNPTGMMLSFRDPQRPAGESDTTRVIRLPPGDTDLGRLVRADEIAEQVCHGQMGLEDGLAALAALDNPPGRWARAVLIFAFGLASASVAGLFRLSWLDMATAGVIGLMIGLVEVGCAGKPRLAEASEAIAGVVSGTLAVLVAALIAPINLNMVIIASLIVLLPGMALTNAVNELTSRHLISGTARFAGAITTVMKLAVGTAIALGAANLFGLDWQVQVAQPQARWLQWVALVSASAAFVVLFRAPKREYITVMLAAMSSYLISHWVGVALGSVAGVFIAALVMTAAGNGYARWLNRPGALVRLPGIILLVPGSTSLRGLMDLIQQQDAAVGQAAVLTVLNILLALLAGLLFGNLLLPTRRNL